MDSILKKTIFKMILGLFIYQCIFALISFFLRNILDYNYIKVFNGICVGFVISILALLDMAKTCYNSAWSQDFNYARKKTIISLIIRRAVLLIILILFWNGKYANPLAIVIATLGIKFAAFFVIIINKIIK